MPHLGYLFMEFGVLCTIAAFVAGSIPHDAIWHAATTRVAGLLLVAWVVVDQAGMRLGLWGFPAEGTLSLRVLGMPLEEYLCLFLHVLLCFLLVEHFSFVLDRR